MDDDRTTYLEFELDELLDNTREKRDRARFSDYLKSVGLSLVSVSIVTAVVAIVFSAVIRMIDMKVPSIDKEKCTCDCWDGLFKGHYGRGKDNRYI